MNKPFNFKTIVCKNFHEIHTELLECFYSYMQTIPNNKFSLYFILLTEAVSFIPDNIVNCCKRIHVARPTRLQYNKLITTLETSEGVKDIKNIKQFLQLDMITISSLICI